MTSKRLDGQVFIRTKGGETVKLSGIEVALISEFESKALRDQYRDEFRQLSESTQGRLTSAEMQLSEARLSRDTFSSNSAAAFELDRKYEVLQKEITDRENYIQRERLRLEEWRSRMQPDSSPFYFQDEANAFRLAAASLAQIERSGAGILKTNREQRAALSQELDRRDILSLKLKQNEFSQQIEQLESKARDLKRMLPIKFTFADFLRSRVPTTLNRKVTDADGRFSFEIRKGLRCAVLAVAERKLINGTEHYTWFLDVTPDQREILLHHGNLLN